MGVIEYPEDLPVSKRRDEIIECLKTNQVIIISGATGSGKTTQIPKMCLDAGFGIRGKIGCTQPRRVAALSVAQRIAEELKVEYGIFVGSKIRFHDQTSEETKIQIMTDGILLQEMQIDSELSKYEVLIIDEAHERSLNIDFILGLLRQLIRRRKDLKVVVTSATIDTQKFSKAFENAPIIEVSGQLYPIDLIYRPIDLRSQDSGEYTYIDGAVSAVEDLLMRKDSGDVLVFMPTESDIRECMDLMVGRLGNGYEVIPLFGRLSNADQQRIFHPGARQRVVISTNIAETSITVPRIGAVVDSGLARISRYSHATNTLRLPVENISQSSANQRMGRCGRLRNGVCIRLYSEEDYLGRPVFTEPEIHRSNLGSVILKLLDFKITDITKFPFIDSPDSGSIKGAFKLLHILAAIDDCDEITKIGRKLARLPLDLSIGRMLLRAQEEGVLPEVSIIAAGLSIQDPRERPENKKELAEQEQKKFIHKESDFISLLNIWITFHNDLERMSQSQMRKFCKKHFLSYSRMREWLDLYHQIKRVFKKVEWREVLEISESLFDPIHRSILSGLLQNIAEKKSGNIFTATHNREVSIFPGSGLFDRKAIKQQMKAKTKWSEVPRDVSMGTTPEWVMASSITETNRLYLRNVAKIDVSWVIQVGEHLIKKSYVEPYWNEKSGRVLVKEKVCLFGLLLTINQVAFSKIDPNQAKEIFIRSALISGELRDILPVIESNKKLIELVENDLSRKREVSSWYLQERIFTFYDLHLPAIGSVHDLKKWLKNRVNQKKLTMRMSDLLDGDQLSEDEGNFPKTVKVGNQDYPIQYYYKPGEDIDGATLKINPEGFFLLSQSMVDWIIPGYIKEKVELWLRALPKAIRTQLFPINEAVERIYSHLKRDENSLKTAIVESIHALYGIAISKDLIQVPEIPKQLQLRFEVIDRDERILCSGRDFQELGDFLKKKTVSVAKNDDLWGQSVARYRIKDVRESLDYSFPERLEIGKISGVTLFAYPGFDNSKEGRVGITIYKNIGVARSHNIKGFRKLGESVLAKDIAWLHRDLKDLKRCQILYSTMGSLDVLKEDCLECILKGSFDGFDPIPLDSHSHIKHFNQIRDQWREIIPQIIDTIVLVLELRQKLLVIEKTYPNMSRDIKMLLPARFMKQTPLKWFFHLPRFLQAMQFRFERWKNNVPKDLQKQSLVDVYEIPFFDKLKQGVTSQSHAEAVNHYFWLLQEFKVSTFAPELKTSVKVSLKLMREELDRIKS